MSNSPATIYLKDYQAPSFEITKTDLHFDLFDEYAIVKSTLHLQRKSVGDLCLHGQELELLFISIDGRDLSASEYMLDDQQLTLSDLDNECVVAIATKIYPHKNTSLEGLYKSQTMFCTQCEAEGFRKITYYLDRPDALSEFTTTVVANKQKYPILLSNGNQTKTQDLGERHAVTWHDPFKKPAYLFALVAGDLSYVDDSFTTMSGRDVLLRIFVEPKDLDKVGHGMASLKNAMRWDETVYGREYDLDIFMIVAVDDFNMGAMENKGLNIFNTSCVLANPKTTTDAGFQRVEGVVAHEYFHNWSGNRVTCRDWFQLSLKEGFTVFRDAEFSSDMGSRTVKRVEDVSLLRTMQFAEDAGPMAHAVRPESFIEISNFYTLTIYEKGAEVVRMIHTLLGEALFRQGSDLYFSRHDGQAVTIEDFIACMAEVSGRDFTQFMNWYRQAGTPKLKVKQAYDSDTQQFTLTFSQSCRATPECDKKQPFTIPIRLSLIGTDGLMTLNTPSSSLVMADNKTEGVFELTHAEESLTFEGVTERPVASLLRDFSAPVTLDLQQSREDLLTIITQDTDGFNRWEASQKLAILVIQEVMAQLTQNPAPKVDPLLLDAYSTLLADTSQDQAMVALMLTLPSEQYLAQLATPVDVDLIHHARERVARKLAVSLYDTWLATYQALNATEVFATDAASIAKRSLKNTALAYLVRSGKSDAFSVCKAQLRNATNMTDELAALTALAHANSPSLVADQQQALNAFYEKWQDEALVVNSWFAVQSTKPVSDSLEQVKALMNHAAFDFNNPNKLRSLIGGFVMRNPIGFHVASGAGYGFLADQIIALNKTNPQIAARLLSPLVQWKKYDAARQEKMKMQLTRILNEDALSNDVYEVVTKALA